MLYELNEFKKAAMVPAHLWSEAAGLFLNTMPKECNPVGRILSAGNEVLERATRHYIKPEFGIDPVLATLNGRPKKIRVTEEIICDRPFCHLLHFKRHNGKARFGENDPTILIVAPLSGHFATLLRDTVRALLPDHNVFITDWKDARLIPLVEGAFSLDHYVDLLLDFLSYFKGNVHLMAVCQPVVPALMAVSYLAMIDSPYQPKSMILMGGPVDARVNPGAVNAFAKDHTIDWFERTVITKIPSYYPGAMRSVCPGFIMLHGFMALNIERHQEASIGLFQHLVQGDMETVESHRAFYDEYRAVLDIPAEYFIQSVDRVFKKFDLPLGRMTFRGHPIDPAFIRKTALFTIEGERDDISCPGQTYAAHRLCARVADYQRSHYVQPGVGHYGIFNGKRWRNEIKPRIAEFVRQFE